MIRFEDIGHGRYRVYAKKTDTDFCGTVEKQEFTSINMGTGKRVARCFWKAYGVSGGWRTSSIKGRFATREEAAKALVKDSKTPYDKKSMRWSKRQGESAAAKAIK